MEYWSIEKLQELEYDELKSIEDELKGKLGTELHFEYYPPRKGKRRKVGKKRVHGATVLRLGGDEFLAKLHPLDKYKRIIGRIICMVRANRKLRKCNDGPTRA